MKRNRSWQEGLSKSITFIVTKDCQLACKYCYLVGKNSNERMTWDVAKKAIDYILDCEAEMEEESVIWDFIGGEPFLEIDLIDRICDYLKTEMYRRNHHWFNSYRFSFSTNGINYDSEKVQQFINKNHNHLSIGITIDGTKRKHDLNRIWKGAGPEIGSYDDVVRNIPLWLKQFPNGGTKVTISSADIPYIKESVLHLYSLGIHEVNINCVFEDVWKDGDDKLFEDQLLQLADSIIDGEYYKDYSCSFFNENIGRPMDCKLQNQNWCGAGKMLAICICLKKVDSQKESIIMTPHTEFQKKYYQQVIEIHQKTGFSPRKIAKLQLVPVSVRQMYHWIAIFEAENGKGSPRRIMEAKKSKEQAEMESLKSRISELEESLRVERLRNRLNEKIIDIAEARWHIEIRKKAGTKR